MNKQKMKKTLDFSYFLTSLRLFIFEEWCQCTFKRNKHKNSEEKIYFLLASWRSLTKRAVSRAEVTDLHPYPYQNVMDLEHWFKDTRIKAKRAYCFTSLEKYLENVFSWNISSRSTATTLMLRRHPPLPQVNNHHGPVHQDQDPHQTKLTDADQDQD